MVVQIQMEVMATGVPQCLMTVDLTSLAVVSMNGVVTKLAALKQQQQQAYKANRKRIFLRLMNAFSPGSTQESQVNNRQTKQGLVISKYIEFQMCSLDVPIQTMILEDFGVQQN